jgi:hypothetical protein
MQSARINQKVKYASEGRPFLKGLNGKVINYNESSALVEFTKPGGPGEALYTEWVGLRYLEELPDGPIHTALQDLEAKKEDQKKKIREAQTVVEKLRKEEDQIHRAIDALRQVSL